MIRFLLNMISRFDRWPRRARSAIKFSADVVMVIVAFLAAVLLRYGGSLPPGELSQLGRILLFVVALKVLTFSYFGMYLDLWRYAGLSDLARLVRVNVIASMVVGAFSYLALFSRLPRGVFLMDAAFCLLLMGGIRFSVRWIREMPAGSSLRRPFSEEISPENPLKRILVVGAGHAGEMMVREMRRRVQWVRMNPVGFVDDDPAKKGMFIHGVPVLGGCEEIPSICSEIGVDRITLCLPSVSGPRLRRIMEHCRSSGRPVDIVPRLEEMLAGQARISDVREVRVEDLLGREKIEFDMDRVASSIRGRRILITGAGGSIGSELCRQVARYQPAEVVLLGRGENSIFEIASELAQTHPQVRRREVIGDVINPRKLEGVFQRFHPEVVFHAGADKHVPLMELNPDEAVLNNILGTLNVFDMADRYGTGLLVAISTDKAVRPTSVMGCCKRVAEMIVQSRPRRSLRAVSVRFGNVLGSRGSVIPLFKKQILKGGPVTVTHPKVERYFMTIPEAVALVMQAGATARDGEVYVLDMGEPVLIADLARDMIRLAGLEPDKDVQVVFTGLRPGEKLYEELASPDQTMVGTQHVKIMALRSQAVDHEWLEGQIELLRQAAVSMDTERIIDLLQETVHDYAPSREPSEIWREEGTSIPPLPPGTHGPH